ncbi:hypothetical protein [Krasilnikovia sp. MM14-A1004]|uniref:hypothetical protein n=1 Tax=Krasilnikovia sp. MM14-A1004 TaxID=3373541 RepID=UPI00399C5D1B
MFAGLDEVGWSSLTHAYGPATAMPKVIRGLIARDKRVRAWAGDYMWGAVHHQGDVYECTVAAIPFLVEAASAPRAKGRGTVLRLLASIGSAEVDDVSRLADRDGGLHRTAQRAVATAYPALAALLADPKRKVRRAAPQVLLVCRDRAADVADLLRARLPVEPDASVRMALVAAVGTITRRAVAGYSDGVDAAELRDWLRAVFTGTDPAGVRTAALMELLRLSDGELPDLVPTLLHLLETADGVDLRSLREALGDRVTERNRLLAALVRDGSRGLRNNAMWATAGALHHWRGDYRELLAEFAALLPGSPDDHLLAVHLLTGDGWPLTAPLADDIAASIDRSLAAGAPLYRPEGRGFWDPQGGPVWALTQNLVNLGDPRALPLVRQAYEGDVLPHYTGSLTRPYGADAAALVPPIRRWLRRLTADGDIDRAMDLLGDLIPIGPAAAGALPEIVALLPYPNFWHTPMNALRALGPAAVSAASLIRERLHDPEPSVVAAAAAALPAVEGERAEAEVRPLLTHDSADVCLSAADALHAAGVTDVLAGYEAALRYDGWPPYSALHSLGTLGAAAGPLASRVRAMLDDPDIDGLAAATLWRITGDLDTTLPVLARAWRRERRVHTPIAVCWAEMGPAAAPAGPLLRTELSTVTRATYRPDGQGSTDIENDEEFLRACASALTSITSGG